MTSRDVATSRGIPARSLAMALAALESGAGSMVMLHPDYQYSPGLLGTMAWLVASGEFDVLLGSRIFGKGALAGGMPLSNYIANRFLTLGVAWTGPA